MAVVRNPDKAALNNWFAQTDQAVFRIGINYHPVNSGDHLIQAIVSPKALGGGALQSPNLHWSSGILLQQTHAPIYKIAVDRAVWITARSVFMESLQNLLFSDQPQIERGGDKPTRS